MIGRCKHCINYRWHRLRWEHFDPAAQVLQVGAAKQLVLGLFVLHPWVVSGSGGGGIHVYTNYRALSTGTINDNESQFIIITDSVGNQLDGKLHAEAVNQWQKETIAAMLAKMLGNSFCNIDG